MASPTLKELQYRKFDDLLNEVYIDLPSLTREGMVEPAQLIKIAQTCNYEMGLKIYKTKETLLVVEHGRTKLPSDFHMLNYAVLCSHYRICEPGTFSGLHTEDVYTPISQSDVYHHSIERSDVCENNLLPSDPWHQDKCFVTCNGKMEVNVIEYHSNEIREYSSFEQIRMVPSKEASSFCVNTSFRNAPHTGSIKDGFLWVPTMRERGGNGHGRMYICYLGAMEDEDGNLLVLDHPKINEYYEWALKERILQNLYLNGETDLLQRWQMAKKERDSARIQALSITTMPDFYELRQVIESNRRVQYHKYLHPFSSLYSNTPGWPWSINNEKI